jgi:hypothetical protein
MLCPTEHASQKSNLNARLSWQIRTNEVRLGGTHGNYPMRGFTSPNTLALNMCRHVRWQR